MPLSFVHEEAPIFLARGTDGLAPGPSVTERLRLYALARLILGASVRNLQVSWVKEGLSLAGRLLGAGVNDLGGTLMNESISTAAGSRHGQLLTPAQLRAVVRSAGRVPAQRSTLELLQYLTINAQASTTYYLRGTWDHWEALASSAKAVDLASFPVALKAQERAVARLLAPISDKAWRSLQVKPMSGKGRKLALDVALFETTLTMCIGYRMQLFLQAKAAGLGELKSSDLWAGKP